MVLCAMLPQDIGRFRELHGLPACVFASWVDVSFETQERILTLCAHCSSIDVIAVLRDRKWRMPDTGPPIRVREAP